MAVAVRRADGTIVVREDAWISLAERKKFLRWPLFRGALVLVESIYNGLQALNFAAAHAMQDEADAPADPSEPVEPQKNGWTMALSFAIAIGLFVGLPHLLAWGTGEIVNRPLDVDSFAFHVLDGLFKLAIFVGYIAGISLIPEIRRVFEYHGAEHMVVNAYENELDLTVENAKRFTTFHARCGTSFILFVLVLSIFMFAAVFPFIPTVSDITVVNHIAMIFIKIPLMAPLAGIAYEINRFAAKHPEQLWVQLLVGPGRLMQKLTTRQPDDDQLEIALSAMRAALAREASLVDVGVEAAQQIAKAQPVGGRVVVFESYGELAAAIDLGH
jgi:uncharacterized protein YqhQ